MTVSTRPPTAGGGSLMGVVPYRIMESVSVRSRYVSLTDAMIHSLESEEWRPDYVVCLDKSGRPVAWLLRALWPVLAREPGTPFQQNVVPPLPQFRFVNIDREQWWDQTGATETGTVDVTKVPVEAIDSLRSVFVKAPGSPGTSPFESSAWLDGRRILVVDEVSNTGDTLRIASGLLARAFPTADIRGDHWMSPGTSIDRSGLRRTANVPIWYRDDTWHGRLIGNRLDPDNPPATARNRTGGLFLSTRPRVPDALGRQLRDEVASLAQDVREGRLLARPAGSRDLDDWLGRILGLYGFEDPRAFTAAREIQDRAG